MTDQITIYSHADIRSCPDAAAALAAAARSGQTYYVRARHGWQVYRDPLGRMLEGSSRAVFVWRGEA